MLAVKRKALRSAKFLGTRRYSAPSVTHAKGDDHSHDHSHDDHHHEAPADEPMGRGFYVVLAALPVSIGVYTLSRPGKDGEPNGVTKLMNYYSSFHEDFTARNAYHTKYLEQAAYDRNLFQSAGPSEFQLRFPEVFNTGSPYNVVAGQGARNMDEVVAHYRKLNEDEAERRETANARKAAWYKAREEERAGRKWKLSWP